VRHIAFIIQYVPYTIGAAVGHDSCEDSREQRSTHKDVVIMLFVYNHDNMWNVDL